MDKEGKQKGDELPKYEVNWDPYDISIWKNRPPTRIMADAGKEIVQHAFLIRRLAEKILENPHVDTVTLFDLGENMRLRDVMKHIVDEAESIRNIANTTLAYNQANLAGEINVDKD